MTTNTIRTAFLSTFIATLTLLVGSGPTGSAPNLPGTLSRAAYAQDAPAPKPGKIDPQARQRVDAMIATYKRMKSFSANVYLDGRIEQKQVHSEHMETRLSVQKPNRLAINRVTTSSTSQAHHGEKVSAVYNGSHLLVKSSRRKTQYVKVQMPPERGVVAAFLSAGFIAPGVSVMLQEPELVFYKHPLLAPYISLSMGSPDVLAGVPVETVIWKVDQGDFSTTTATYYIGREDHLLRRVEFKFMFQGRTNRSVESYSRIKVNPALPPSAFVFIPPRGARPVEYFRDEE